MNKAELLQKLIATHKRVNVNNLTDQEWQDYKKDRRDMERQLAELKAGSR